MKKHGDKGPAMFKVILEQSATDIDYRLEKLYDKYVNGTLDKNIAKRCCNFKLLEEKCKEYNK